MNNENNNIPRERTVRILAVACGFLFFAFSVLYLAVFQVDVAEALHHELSRGKTVYSPWISAVLVTVVLMLLCWLINGFVRLRGAMEALSYFPACLILGVLMDVGYEAFHGACIWSQWTWLLPLLLGLYVVSGFFLSRLLHFLMNPNCATGIIVNSNLFILLMLCFMTVGIGNTDIHFHHELQMEEALRKQDYEEARKVAGSTMDPSRNLTALRAYSMSREGTMGEYLFQYPQLYGAAGLLMGTDERTTVRMDADSLYTYLGDCPAVGEPALKFFRRICQEETGNHTTLDYYLSALLLERKLDEFVSAYNDLYAADGEVPRYYRQALFLYRQMHPSVALDVTADAAMEELWGKYTEKQQELTGQRGEGNRMRREFGDTYWWYYQYK